MRSWRWRVSGCFGLKAALLGAICFLIRSVTAADGEIDWAKERQFWAFQAPKAQARPDVKHSRWPRQDLDYFVLAKMEEHGLSPSVPSDRLTLLKRAAYDLTGLPPEPAVAREFLADERGDAFEHLVDRLLASPSFGERMASMWLPLARYAEDQAHQVGSDTKFFYPNAFKYRRWVIGAFNRDLPYPEFIKLQLAADKFPEADTNDLPALGFIGLGPKYYNRDRLEVQADEWEDRVDTVSRTFLGLTVACARCHDHKFDPITREDYYGLAGVFASSKMINRKSDGSEEKSEKAKEMAGDVVHMVEDNNPHDLNVFIRGNVKRLGPLAPRQFIQVLARPDQKPISEGSGRREIAEDIADWRNPLTARVIVNRLWGVMTGAPIVQSPSNFGHSGQAPSNRELLDYLATRFIAQGGSIKKLMREIALSATYQQSSFASDKLMAIDPSNQFFARMNRRRLTAEQWRDSMLYFSNELVREGGKSMELDDAKNLRRTVYARISRLQLNAMLATFDYPDANVHAEKRATTTTAIQKLFEMNGEFITKRAKTFAALLAEGEAVEKKRVERAYALLFNRAPEKDELDLALGFLDKSSTSALTRWEQYAQSLLISNEVMYVD
jgi:hypothetical protein